MENKIIRKESFLFRKHNYLTKPIFREDNYEYIDNEESLKRMIDLDLIKEKVIGIDLE